jgi:ParB family chromosome partitioning protein
VLPDPELAYKILALNTEKAHNLREKALETVRMARDLAEKNSSAAEKDYALEFEEPAFLTLGFCYEENGRFSGGAYHPVLKKVDEFSESTLPEALEKRKGRAEKILELDRVVNEAVAALKERGFQSPYLKAFVVGRVNPLRFQKGTGRPSFDATIAKMLTSARNFKAGSIKVEQLARAGGPPAE